MRHKEKNKDNILDCTLLGHKLLVNSHGFIAPSTFLGHIFGLHFTGGWSTVHQSTSSSNTNNESSAYSAYWAGGLISEL
jgi:predicted metalloprotease